MKPVTIPFDFYIACTFKDVNLYLKRARRFFYKQHQAENAKKLSKRFWQTCPKNKFVCISDVILLIVMIMIMAVTK